MNSIHKLFVCVFCFTVAACSTRPDYSALKVVGTGTSESVGNSCEAIGKNYSFYRYTCTGWNAPAERCLKSDEDAHKVIERISNETGQACRIMEIIRSQ